MTGVAPYRTFDDAIRDGWWIGIGSGPSWWGRDLKHRYHLTAKREPYHVELAGNNLVALRREVLKLSDLPRDDLLYTSGYWGAIRSARIDREAQERLARERVEA